MRQELLQNYSRHISSRLVLETFSRLKPFSSISVSVICVLAPSKKRASSSSSSRSSRDTRWFSVPGLFSWSRERKAKVRRKATSSAPQFGQRINRRWRIDIPSLPQTRIKLPRRIMDYSTSNSNNPHQVPLPTQFVYRINYFWTASEHLWRILRPRGGSLWSKLPCWISQPIFRYRIADKSLALP